MTERTKLAVIGGFTKPRDSIAHGTHHASYVACQALAAVGGYSEIHVYQEFPPPPGRGGELILPKQPPSRVFDKSAMPTTSERYQAIYIANGEQIGPVPYLLRPHDDWAPLICSVGTAHSAAQWHSLLVALASGAVRTTDGFVFKSRAARALFREVWSEWTGRLGMAPPFPESSVVIPNGVDVELHRRSPPLRDEARRQLRLGAQDVVFLAFSRLSPGTKGDQQALIVRWRDVLQRFPQAVLVLAGAQVDRNFTMEQRQLARAAGVAERVLVVENPFELMPNARGSLMSAADVFVHLTTGTEEVSPLVTHEAMAHGLPVIATDWAGNAEVIADGETGYLIATRAAPVAAGWNAATFATTDLPVALAASRSVACGFDDFVMRAVALADPQRRLAMGAAARKSVEGRTTQMVARAHADFIRERSAEARVGWSGQHAFRPLITMDQVLGAQTAGRLAATDRVRLANGERAVLLTTGWQPDSAPLVEVALAALRGQPEVALGALAERLYPPPPTVTGSARQALAFQAASRLLVRLLNYDVIRLVDSGNRTT